MSSSRINFFDKKPKNKIQKNLAEWFESKTGITAIGVLITINALILGILTV